MLLTSRFPLHSVVMVILFATTYPRILLTGMRTSYVSWFPCQCDTICKNIRGYCLNYENWSTSDSSTTIRISDHFHCTKFSQNKLHDYVMVTKCPSNWGGTPDTARECALNKFNICPLTGLPLVDMATNLTYANSYCARCHNTSSDLRYWKILVAYAGEQSQDLYDINSNGGLSWRAIPIERVYPDKCNTTPPENETTNQISPSKNPFLVILQTRQNFSDKEVSCRSHIRVASFEIEDRKTIFAFPFKEPVAKKSTTPKPEVNLAATARAVSYSTNATKQRYGPEVPENKSNKLQEDRARDFITYVGFSLSITALSFLLLTYCLFAELRTYPGKTVMHLSCALIAMQLTYLVSNEDVSSVVCALLGVLLHYFILAVFLWTSAIARHTQKTFTDLRVSPKNILVVQERKKAYISYCVFSWGIPFIVVGICVTLQLTNTGSVGYGTEFVCQLSFSARLYAISIPVSLLLLFNLIALIRTVVAIKRKAGNMRAPHRKKLPTIVLKLTIIMGITWIPGTVVAFLPNHYLEDPFFVLNSFQGVLICFSFVCKRQIIRLYKQKFALSKSEKITFVVSANTTNRSQVTPITLTVLAGILDMTLDSNIRLN